MYEKDTIISPISSVSGASVSLIRISGTSAIQTVNRFFPSVNLENVEGGRFYFGKLIAENNQIIDEVIVYVFRAPKSYTGEDIVEISCHSNVFIIEEVLQLFIQNGCRTAKPGEFTQRAFLNGKMDLTQAEAVADIISSKSKAGVKNSLLFLEGDLSLKIKELKKNIVDIASLLELGLDFSEENLEIVSNEDVRKKLSSLLKEIKTLINSFSNTRNFQKGIEVLLVGEPNVGKSSLMNALLEKDRVIVSHIPGTTRDIIHEDIILEDTLVRFIDTAGIRITDDHIEASGVDRVKNLIDKVDIVLALFDLAEGISKENKKLLYRLIKDRGDDVIIIGNKIDKEMKNETVDFINSFANNKILVSAKLSKNIDQLRNAISFHIRREIKKGSDELILTNKRHYNILLQIEEKIINTQNSLSHDPGHEFIAMDLREIINKLSEITGEITTDDILNNIFSSFCIGK
jgi:tRNA modification GTPase